MIHLDTNYLIALVGYDKKIYSQVETWLRNGEKLCISSLVWFEFLNGNVTKEEIDQILQIIEQRIIPFETKTTEQASRWHHKTGKIRYRTIDCCIAATAYCATAHLATENKKDFKAFEKLGLKII